jgi:DNA-binding NarL/FixJ family response regulator
LEIKESDRLKNLPVVIFSTSYNPDMANTLYECGANYYIRKPASFSDLVKVLKQTLLKVTGDRLRRPSRGSFLIQL